MGSWLAALKPAHVMINMLMPKVCSARTLGCLGQAVRGRDGLRQVIIDQQAQALAQWLPVRRAEEAERAGGAAHVRGQPQPPLLPGRPGPALALTQRACSASARPHQKRWWLFLVRIAQDAS